MAVHHFCTRYPSGSRGNKDQQAVAYGLSINRRGYMHEASGQRFTLALRVVADGEW